MALIPGIFIKGKFKPFNECTIQELESAVINSKIKSLIILGLCSAFIGAIITILF